jgi:hypothetical protein
VLKKTVGKASGGSADIHADSITNVDAPMLQRLLKLEAAAAYVRDVGNKQAKGSRCIDLSTGLGDFLRAPMHNKRSIT